MSFEQLNRARQELSAGEPDEVWFSIRQVTLAEGQTTLKIDLCYELSVVAHSSWEIVAKGVVEHHLDDRPNEFADDSLAGDIDIIDNHPLLRSHVGIQCQLYIGKTCSDFGAFLGSLTEEVWAWGDRWRPLTSFLHAPQLREHSFGLLAQGPRDLMLRLLSICEQFNLKGSMIEMSRRPERQCEGSPKLLLIGNSYIIAEHFECKPVV